MQMTAGGSYNMQNFLERMRKGVGDQQKTHFFGIGIFKRVAQFYGITVAVNFDFLRISKANLETSVEYLQRHFLNHPARFFFWNRSLIDR